MKQSKKAQLDNERAAWSYEQYLLEKALARFDWIGLPESVDLRYLEFVLTTYGVATIHIDEATGQLMAHKAVVNAPQDSNSNYLTWRANGDAGHYDVPVSFDGLTGAPGVLIWDNLSRFNAWEYIRRYAEKMALCDRVCDAQVVKQMSPVVLETTPENKNGLLQQWNMARNNEPVILKADVMNTIASSQLLGDITFTAPDIFTYKKALEQEFNLTMGMETEPVDRVNVADIIKVDQEAENRRLGYLKPRRTACTALANMFGLMTDVVWALDTPSKNFNALTNIGEQASLGLLGGNQGMNNGAVENAQDSDATDKNKGE